MNQQLLLWDEIYQKKVFNKPIRLIELFAGIGSQKQALDKLGVKYEHYKIVDWYTHAFKAYNAAHTKDFEDYSIGLSKDELVNKIYGISTNSKSLMPQKVLHKKNIQWLRDIYNNIVATSNLVNISFIKGEDLEIVDTNSFDYILTYSFPCQDLSKAGKGKGMKKGDGTRSGLLWEVERILDELANYYRSPSRNTKIHSFHKTYDPFKPKPLETSRLPQVLLMENVPDVIGKKNISDFKKWESKLRELGYKNYIEVLNSKDYLIPQNRRRCYMISILGDYCYEFPKKMKPNYVLKDFLDEVVDLKYFLSQSQIEKIAKWKSQQNPLNNISKEIISTITARGAGENHSGMKLVEYEIVDYSSSDNFRKLIKDKHEIPTLTTKNKFAVNVIGSYLPKSFAAGKVYDSNGLAPTFLENHGSVMAIVHPGEKLLVKENTKQGYREANDGDGIILNRTSKKRGTVQNQSLPTITCAGGQLGVLLRDHGNYFSWGEHSQSQRAYKTSKNIGTIAASTFGLPKIKENQVLRKITPIESTRLMGFNDEIYQSLSAIQLGDTIIYKLDGNSIVVQTLMAIFGSLLSVNNYEVRIHESVKEIVNGTRKKDSLGETRRFDIRSESST